MGLAQATVLVAATDKSNCRSTPIKPGKRLWFAGALYGKEAREVVNILAVWQTGQEEPWFIATSLDEAQLAERLYRKRMKIEHSFRDWKHHLKLKGTLKVESPERAQVLLRTLALLYGGSMPPWLRPNAYKW